MEMVWEGDSDLGTDGTIFTGVLYNLYQPPPGFCFDSYCSDPPIQDDPDLFDMNIAERAKALVAEATSQREHYRHNHVLLTMGSDFQYSNANMWYKNLDKLIKYFKVGVVYCSKMDHMFASSLFFVYRSLFPFLKPYTCPLPSIHPSITGPPGARSQRLLLHPFDIHRRRPQPQPQMAQ